MGPLGADGAKLPGGRTVVVVDRQSDSATRSSWRPGNSKETRAAEREAACTGYEGIWETSGTPDQISMARKMQGCGLAVLSGIIGDAPAGS